jgi:hypothetical protein
MQQHRMKRAPHPPFSPDLAPSDFYLFGKVKRALMSVTFDDENRLLSGVTTVLIAIPLEELEAIFEEWLCRLAACIPRD